MPGSWKDSAADGVPPDLEASPRGNGFEVDSSDVASSGYGDGTGTVLAGVRPAFRETAECNNEVDARYKLPGGGCPRRCAYPPHACCVRSFTQCRERHLHMIGRSLHDRRTQD